MRITLNDVVRGDKAWFAKHGEERRRVREVYECERPTAADNSNVMIVTQLAPGAPLRTGICVRPELVDCVLARRDDCIAFEQGKIYIVIDAGL